MSEIYYALIIFPILFMIAMGYIYSSALSEIQVQLLKLNCPYPINAAVASNVTLNGVIVEYVTTYDNATGGNLYHITVFHCQDANAGGLGPPTPQVTQTTYTSSANWFGSSNNWFNTTGGYLFYISESITEFFLKVIALGSLIQTFLNAPALVLAIPQYTYVNIILISFIGIGAFMVVRG